MGQDNYAKWEFYVYMATDVPADAAYCWTLAAFILTLEKSELKIWMHIKHCVSSAKAIPIPGTQKWIVLMQQHLMLKIFVGDAWLAPQIFFENFCSEFFKTTLQDVFNMPNTFYVVFQAWKKNVVFMSSISVANRECWSRVAVIS